MSTVSAVTPVGVVGSPTTPVAARLRPGIFADALTSVLGAESFEVVLTDDSDQFVAIARDSGRCIVDASVDGAGDLLQRLAHECPGATVIVVGEPKARAGHGNRRSSSRAYVSDADGLDLVLALLRGERTPTTGVPRQRRRNRLPAARGLARLTARESETLTGLIEGESTKALAARLGVSPATARAHVQSVLNKLGVHSRLEAVARATMDVEPPIPARAS